MWSTSALFQTSSAGMHPARSIDDVKQMVVPAAANSARRCCREWNAMHISIHDIVVDGYECGKCVAPGRQAAREVDLETRIGAERRDARECDTPIGTGDHVAA